MRRPWLLYGLWAGAIALALAWTGYWFWLRGQAIERAAAWTQSQRAAGLEASYARVTATGYPLRLTLTFDDAAYGAPAEGWRVATQKLAFHINPSDFSLFILEPRAPIAWKTRVATRVFTPHTSALSVRFEKGTLARSTLEAEGVSMTRDGADNGAIGKIVASMRADPRAAGDGQLALDIEDWRLAAPLQGLPMLDTNVRAVHARAVFEKGAVLLRPNADRLGAWRDAAGAVRFEGLGADWGGVELDATGALKLDRQRHLEGALDIKGLRSGQLHFKDGAVTLGGQTIRRLESLR